MSVSTELEGEQDKSDGGEDTVQVGNADLSIPVFLVDGEEVLASRKPSWLNWWKLLATAAIIFLASIVVLDLAALAGVLLSGLIVAHVWRTRQEQTYVITNKRIIAVALSHPLLENLVGASDKQVWEVWVDDIRAMAEGTSFFERLVTAITGGTLGHIKLSFGGGILSASMGKKFSIYNHEEVANSIRNVRARSTYDHDELVAAVTGRSDEPTEGTVLESEHE